MYVMMIFPNSFGHISHVFGYFVWLSERYFVWFSKHYVSPRQFDPLSKSQRRLFTVVFLSAMQTSMSIIRDFCAMGEMHKIIHVLMRFALYHANI